MARKKHFTKTIGKYFFNIKMGYNNTIMISRKTKEAAQYAFSQYLGQKKDAEWLGKWDGKKFIETEYKLAS
ncbi:MAG: hypothetical protein AB8F94_06900 [Saprospiraceae bacterium]